MFQGEICYETRKTFETVKTCPEHHSVIIQRSQMKNCSKYPMCHEEQLIYHCFGYNESFVEVCTPINRIVGKKCHLSNNLFKTLQNCFPIKYCIIEIKFHVQEYIHYVALFHLNRTNLDLYTFYKSQYSHKLIYCRI